MKLLASSKSMMRTPSKESLKDARPRSSSKDSARSEFSVSHNGIQVCAGRATKQGQFHGNEDRVFLSDALADFSEAYEEQLISLSDMLSSLNPKANAQEEEEEFSSFMEKAIFGTVFDGHGGEKCAEFLQKNMHLTFAKKCAEHESKYGANTTLSATEKLLRETFAEMDASWMREADRIDDNSGACSLAALVYGRHIYVAHCGDCRAVLRMENGETIALTNDHRATDPQELARITNAGGHVQGGRIGGVLAPSRAFGDRDIKALFPEGAMISTPEVRYHLLNVEDIMGGGGGALSPSRKGGGGGSSAPWSAFMILATDGVWDILSNNAACDFVGRILTKSNGNADLAALKLVEVASKHNSDDITVAVFVWSAEEDYLGKSRVAGSTGGATAASSSAVASNTASPESNKKKLMEDEQMLSSPISSPVITKKTLTSPGTRAKLVVPVNGS